MSGKPPIMYGISAARRSERAPANASPMRSAPAATASAIELAEALHGLGQVLVPPPAETYQIKARRLLRSRPNTLPSPSAQAFLLRAGGVTARLRIL